MLPKRQTTLTLSCFVLTFAFGCGRLDYDLLKPNTTSAASGGRAPSSAGAGASSAGAPTGGAGAGSGGDSGASGALDAGATGGGVGASGGADSGGMASGGASGGTTSAGASAGGSASAGAGSAGAPPVMLTDCASYTVGGSWVLVPGDPDYGTSNFCVMKYEAKNVANSPQATAAGLPWLSISPVDARTVCASLGTGFHLITNMEWMTIGANIANVATNWSGGSVGAGTLARGHTDIDPNAFCAASSNDSLAFVEKTCTPIGSGGGEDDELTQRRTLILSSGGVVWDLSGNCIEWTNDVVTNKNPGLSNTWFEYSSVTGVSTLPLWQLVPTHAVKPFWKDTWNSAQSIGRLFTGVDGAPGIVARGGPFWDNSTAGIFYVSLDFDPTKPNGNNGFRCAGTPL